MSGMKDLFGDAPYSPRTAHELARGTDPQTSHDAAERILSKLGKLQREVYGVIKRHGASGITLWEIEEIFGNHGSTYRTRVAELCGKGSAGTAVNPPLVKDSGRTRKIRGRERTVWIATGEEIT